MSDRQFRFTMRATAKDGSGYYHPRWDLATRITVIAPTRAEAVEAASEMLGDHGRGRGWYWVMRIDSVDLVVPCHCPEHQEEDQ